MREGSDGNPDCVSQERYLPNSESLTFGPVGSGEQVADRAQPERVAPAPTAMSGRIADHVTSLAERGEIARAVVAGIMVQVGAGENYARDERPGRRVDAGEGELVDSERVRPGQGPHPLSSTIAPGRGVEIPPCSFVQVQHVATVGTPAAFAPAPGAAKPDQVGQLRPVDRVKPAMFGGDRHGTTLNHCSPERKGKKTLTLSLAGVLPDNSAPGRSTRGLDC